MRKAIYYVASTLLEYTFFCLTVGIGGAISHGILKSHADTIAVMLTIMLTLAFWHFFRKKSCELYKEIIL